MILKHFERLVPPLKNEEVSITRLVEKVIQHQSNPEVLLHN